MLQSSKTPTVTGLQKIKSPAQKSRALEFIGKKLFFRYLESDALFVTIDYVSTVLNRSLP